jgi:hypothetical protein
MGYCVVHVPLEAQTVLHRFWEYDAEFPKEESYTHLFTKKLEGISTGLKNKFFPPQKEAVKIQHDHEPTLVEKILQSNSSLKQIDALLEGISVWNETLNSTNQDLKQRAQLSITTLQETQKIFVTQKQILENELENYQKNLSNHYAFWWREGFDAWLKKENFLEKWKNVDIFFHENMRYNFVNLLFLIHECQKYKLNTDEMNTFFWEYKGKVFFENPYVTVKFISFANQVWLFSIITKSKWWDETSKKILLDKTSIDAFEQEIFEKSVRGFYHKHKLQLYPFTK